MTDSDDDYCVSYIVTMVDVRSCTRPHRSHDHLPTSVYTYLYIHNIIIPYNTHIHICTHTRKHTHKHTHAHRHTQTYTETHKYAHMYIYVCFVLRM